MQKTKSNAVKKFQKNLQLSLMQYYAQALSDSIKRGLKGKRKY